MGSEKKNTLPLKFRLPRADTLLALSSKITHCKKNNFIYRYGQILDILTTSVDVSAMMSLSQYYDPPLSSEALHLSNEEVSLGLGARGFARKFLEDKAWALEKEGKWLPFSAIIALLIYGVVLFPNDDYYINHSIISMFVSVNPIISLVSGVYYCLHARNEKRKGMVLSCASLLYTWILSHMPQKGTWVDLLKDLRWSQKYASLTVEALLGKRDCRAKESYRQWVVQREKEVKLPYSVDVQIPPPEPKTKYESKEEVGSLKAIIAQLTKENEDLLSKLHALDRDHAKLKRKSEEDIELLS
ncbi:hypothetical protein KIW84_043838 [Lathyrus oleraceus]|uniref:DUF7745 domain-containing protein n=1 Tax=Pisum sativum TaxID=3888 RepID=A0A9D4XGM9_PEA|nr:hypothetical protein KIW84_043838 [Pisum sativum]